MSQNVIIAVPGNHKWPKPDQDYQQVITKFQFKDPNLSSFFNSVLSEAEYDIYGFLKPNTKFSTKTALTKIVDIFNIPNVGAVYCDSTIEVLPPFNVKYNPLDTSLFINGMVRQNIRFNDVDNLLADMYTQLVKNHLLLIHVAEPLLE